VADAVIIGGGVIGLSIARELRCAGVGRVVVIERGDLGHAASHAAAGMLAPQAEADARDAFFHLAHESRRIYRSFAAELLEETGVDIELDETGILYLAFTDEELDALARRFAWQRGAGLAVERLSAGEILDREPHLSHAVRGGLFFPEDGQVENRRLTHALAAACAKRRVTLLTETEVSGIETDRESAAISSGVRAVVTSRGRISTELVIVAAGAWASEFNARDSDAFRIEPVRGQMLCFTATPPVVRHVIYSPRAYLVPRKDGRLLVGATVERAGFDARVTAHGLHALTAGALEISTHIGDLPFREAWAGLRPHAPDGLPVIGRSPRINGVILATGHYRNGILLAPDHRTPRASTRHDADRDAGITARFFARPIRKRRTLKHIPSKSAARPTFHTVAATEAV
jgi:glycine oxidase